MTKEEILSLLQKMQDDITQLSNIAEEHNPYKIGYYQGYFAALSAIADSVRV